MPSSSGRPLQTSLCPSSPISVCSRCIFEARSISPDALLQRSTAPDIPLPVVHFFHTLRPGRTVVILQHTNVVVCHVAMTTTPNCDTERQSPLQFALPAAFTPHTSLSPPPNELPVAATRRVDTKRRSATAWGRAAWSRKGKRPRERDRASTRAEQRPAQRHRVADS